MHDIIDNIARAHQHKGRLQAAASGIVKGCFIPSHFGGEGEEEEEEEGRTPSGEAPSGFSSTFR